MAEFHIKTSENGKLQGPFSNAQLKNLAEQGKLRPEHLVSANGGASWHPATRVTGLEFSLPHPSPQRPPSLPQEHSPPPQRLSKWVIVGGGIGVLCLVVIAGGMGFLIATGSGDDGSYPAVELDSSGESPSGDDGSYPTVELDSSGESPSADVLSDGPESVTGVDRAGTKGMNFVRVKGKAAGTSRGNEKLTNFKDFESFPEEYVGMFLKFNAITIHWDFERITDPKDAGMFSFKAEGPDGERILSTLGTLYDIDIRPITMVISQPFGRGLLSEFRADQKILGSTIYCEIGLAPTKRKKFARIARTYKIEIYNRGGNISRTFEDK